MCPSWNSLFLNCKTLITTITNLLLRACSQSFKGMFACKEWKSQSYMHKENVILAVMNGRRWCFCVMFFHSVLPLENVFTSATSQLFILLVYFVPYGIVLFSSPFPHNRRYCEQVCPRIICFCRKPLHFQRAYCVSGFQQNNASAVPALAIYTAVLCLKICIE